jgi:hypothetical protein
MQLLELMLERKQSPDFRMESPIFRVCTAALVGVGHAMLQAEQLRLVLSLRPALRNSEL